jgi:hypothetical protein
MWCFSSAGKGQVNRARTRLGCRPAANRRRPQEARLSGARLAGVALCAALGAAVPQARAEEAALPAELAVPERVTLALVRAREYRSLPPAPVFVEDEEHGLAMALWAGDLLVIDRVQVALYQVHASGEVAVWLAAGDEAPCRRVLAADGTLVQVDAAPPPVALDGTPPAPARRRPPVVPLHR